MTHIGTSRWCGMGNQRPLGAQRFVVSVTEPIAEAVAENGTDYGCPGHPSRACALATDEVARAGQTERSASSLKPGACRTEPT